MLLGFRYSPEHYRVEPQLPDPIELIWFVAACLSAIFLLAWVRDKPHTSRQLAWIGIPTMAVGCFLLVKNGLGMRPTFLDPILFCTAIGWAVALWLQRVRSSDPAAHGSMLQISAALWLPVIVWGVAVGLIVYYIFQQIGYWNDLALGYPDCGEYARMIFNTLHNPQELFLRVNPDKPLFCDHFDPGILPFIPVGLLWHEMTATIVLQALAVVGCAVPIYWLGREQFGDKVAALLLATAWLVYPSASQLVYNASYGFHWGSLCLPLCVLALVCWIRKRLGWAALFALWAILIKEEIAILVGSFGLYVAVFERRRLWGAVLAASAFAYFFFVTSALIPSFSHQAYPGQQYFADLGKTKWEILMSPLAKPGIFWRELLSASSFYFAVSLLAPLLFLPVKKTSVLLVGAVIFVFDCLAPPLKSICFQYQTALLPVVFWAAASGLQATTTTRRRAILLGTITSGILLSLFFGKTFWSAETFVTPRTPGRLSLVRRMAAPITPDKSLFATARVAAHFTAQKYLYVDLPVSQGIDYAILDLHDSWRENGSLSWLRDILAAQRQIVALPNMRLVDAEDGLLFYSRTGIKLDGRALVERDVLPPRTIHQEVRLIEGVRLLGLTVDTTPDQTAGETDTIRVTTYCTVDVPTNIDVAVRCVVQYSPGTLDSEAYASKTQPLGEGIWPVARWEPGKFYSDTFLISVPKGAATSQPAISFAATPITN